jgi:hypothetical protein
MPWHDQYEGNRWVQGENAFELVRRILPSFKPFNHASIKFRLFFGVSSFLFP